jgi:hypothetical protein
MIFYGNMCQGTMSPVLYSVFSICLDIQATTLRQASANNKSQGDALRFAHIINIKAGYCRNSPGNARRVSAYYHKKSFL